MRGWRRNPAEAGHAAAPPSAEHARVFSRHAAAAVVAAGLLAALPPAGFALWVVAEVDGLIAAREEARLARGLEDAVEAVGREQRLAAALAAGPGGPDRAAATAGEWLHVVHRHDQSYVLDDADAPLSATMDGRTLPPEVFASVAASVLPLVVRSRGRTAAATAPAEGGVRDVVMLGGQPSVVSVLPLAAPGGAPGWLHVTVRHVDAEFLDGLADRLLLDDLHLRAPNAAAAGLRALPLTAADGAPVGEIAWRPARPAHALMRATAPPLAAALLALIGVGTLLLLRLRRGADALQRRAEEIGHLAYHDALTGLPNRALFDARLDDALARLAVEPGERAAAPRRIAVLYIDLDRFKHVNDTLGHPAGDELIRQVGERLRRTLRAGDTVARLGGDEFAILQEEAGNSERLAERILAAIRQPFDLFGDEAHVDASIGIAIAPEAGRRRAGLMRRADIALYEAKGRGKGRQCTFEPVLDEVVSRKRAIERDLRAALDREPGLRLVYQPILAADGAAVLGAEALARWDHPQHGPLAPSAFIAVAEERGLMPRLGAWVLREACRTAVELALPMVAINVSAVQFRNPGFVDEVLDIARDSGLPAERLQIEITETLLIDGAEDWVGMALARLRFAGARIALDDFGTGYSSLQHLHRFKVDAIKIDRSLVGALGTGEQADGMVRAVLDLARALGLVVTAEGVETRDQWERLVAFGAPQVQGYLFAPPLDRDALAARLVAGASGGEGAAGTAA